jgi:hypothetical protein
VNQTTPFGSCVTATGDSTNPSVVVTSAVGEIVVGVTGGFTAVPSLADAPTQVLLGFADGAAALTDAYSSYEPGAASVTHNYTLDQTHRWGIVAAPLKPL